MRELAKSMVGFSWAVGLFGFQQLSKMLGTVAEPPQVTAAQFDDVSRAAQQHLSDPLAQQFAAGDEWQRRVIDALFDTVSTRSFDPRPLVASMDPRPLMNDIDPRKVVQGGIDLMQRSIDRSIELVRPGSGSASTTAPTAG
ncbi:MAG TPA: hypothetical protein VFZ98_10880 [Vicinamibacterales bacterium]